MADGLAPLPAAADESWSTPYGEIVYHSEDRGAAIQQCDIADGNKEMLVSRELASTCTKRGAPGGFRDRQKKRRRPGGGWAPPQFRDQAQGGGKGLTTVFSGTRPRSFPATASGRRRDAAAVVSGAPGRRRGAPEP